MSADTNIKAYFDLVEMHQRHDPVLTALQAGIIAAAELGIASDSRTFARVFGIEHALVLRDLSGFSHRDVGVSITKRDERTMRTYYTFELRGSK